LRDYIKKPTGTCYPSEFSLLSRVQDNIHIQYSSVENVVSFMNSNAIDIRTSATGWPADFSVLSQIPVRKVNLFYLTPAESILTTNFDISWVSSSKELLHFQYKDMDQLVSGDHPRRMTFASFGTLASCSKLESLLLWNCKGVDLDAIQGLRSIKVLSLKNCGITSIAAIQNFSKLFRLELDYNNVTDISALAYHPAIKELSFAGMQDPIDVDTLLTIPQLSNLYLRDCVPLTADEKYKLDMKDVDYFE
jgi:Leucine-rich repeat (LRR) protein